jgi:hypothetical protein
MRPAFSIGIGTVFVGCLMLFWGCGGNLEDTPDLSQRPNPGAAKKKKTAEMKALAEAAKATGKGMPKGKGMPNAPGPR